MTKLEMDAGNLDKFIHQNGATLIDCVEGGLIDNLLYETKNGAIMALYEHYINEWSSDYIVEISKDRSEKDRIYNDFWTLSDERSREA